MNKKAISEMVSYVLLIVIAVGISIAVYSFLRVYVPKNEMINCGSDVNLVIDQVSCSLTDSKINIELSNKGLFKIDGVYARVNLETKRVRFLLDDDVRFKTVDKGIKDSLMPGEKVLMSYDWPDQVPLSSSQKYILEVQPAKLNDKGKLALCDGVLTTLPISCS